MSLYNGDPKQLSPITLAFIGDGVFELMVRERLLKKGSMPANALHHMAVRKVNATSQASAFDLLNDILTEEERGILMRGRNASTSKVPKTCSPENYRKATAIEALFGYLYLKRDVSRLTELYMIIEQHLDTQE